MHVLSPRPEWRAHGVELRVVVPFTTPELTRQTLAHVATMAGGITCSVRIIDAHVVPFPAQVHHPLECPRFLQARLQALVTDSPLPATAELLFTRDREQLFLQHLPPNSLVVIASGSRWRSTPQSRLARRLSRAGHDVLLLR